MPYIPQKDRERLTGPLGYRPQTPGELNFVITTEILAYIKSKGKRYAILNEVVGVLEQVKDELQRRVIHPYEDEKRKEAGDVYDL